MLLRPFNLTPPEEVEEEGFLESDDDLEVEVEPAIEEDNIARRLQDDPFNGMIDLKLDTTVTMTCGMRVYDVNPP